MATKVQRAKAYSYVRFSTPEQRKGHSYARQTEAAQAYAKQNGLELDTELTLTDLGVSAFKGVNAKTGALGVFLDGVKNGTIPKGSYLLIENLDRLTRDDILEALELFTGIIRRGITLVTLFDRRTYSAESVIAQSMDLMYALMVMSRGHEESLTKSRRVGAAFEKKRKDAAGKGPHLQPFTRMLPGWLSWNDKTLKHEVIKARATVLREIFRKADAGWSKHRIAKWLNERQENTWGGVKRKAAFWHSSYVQKLLRNPAVVGTFTPHRVSKNAAGKRTRKPLEAIEGYWPAVIDGDLFARVSAQASTTAARGRNAGVEPRSIFAGVLKCARCEHSMVRVSKGEQVYLVCSRANARAKGCKYQAVRYDSAEEALRTNIKAIIEDAPRGLEAPELERAIKGQDMAVSAMMDDAQELVALVIRDKSEAAKEALQQKEAELGVARERLRELRSRRDTLAKPNVERRLTAVQEALTRKRLNVSEANKVIKQAVRMIMMDPQQATLVIHWHHASEPSAPFRFHSRHFKPFGVVPGGYVYKAKSKATGGRPRPVSGSRL